MPGNTTKSNKDDNPKFFKNSIKTNLVSLFDGVVKIRDKATISKLKNRSGSISHYVNMGMDARGKSVRPSLGTDSEYAYAMLAEINKRIASGDLKDAVNVFETATDLEIKAAKLKLHGYGATIPQAVEFFINHHRPGQGLISIERASEIFIKNLEQTNRAKTYIKRYKDTYLPQFIKCFSGTRLIDISRDDAEYYIFKVKRNLSAAQKADHITKLRVFFNRLGSMDYCSSEINPFKKVQLPQVSASDDTTLSDRDRMLDANAMEMLLTHAEAKREYEMLSVFTLVGFCGIRTEEVLRLSWDTLDRKPNNWVFETPKIRAKKRRRRSFQIPENAKAWLSVCLKNKPDWQKHFISTHESHKKKSDFGGIDPEAYKQKFGRLKQQIRGKVSGISGVGSPYIPELNYYQNCLRVSFASHGLMCPEFGGHEILLSH